MYQHGIGVAQDYDEALKLFGLAAGQGYDVAADNLGFMYQHGLGVAQDDGEADGWFEFAAHQRRYAPVNNHLGLKRLAELFRTLEAQLNDVDMQRCKGIKLPLTP
jgi:TPR repeat protein